MAATPKTIIPTLDDAGLDALLPDEDPAAFKVFRDSLLEEFAPQTAYQHSLAMNLVSIEWDIARHRRLMAAILREEFRRQTSAIGSTGAPGKIGSFTSNGYDLSAGRSFLAKTPKALEILREAGVTLSEITAAALGARLDTVGYHEGRISDLEKRRRLLKADFDKLQATFSQVEDIEDAVELP